MARDWESTFSNWTGRPSDAEQARYERAQSEIARVLDDSPRLQGHNFRVYPKGSYPNFTNVVRDSDVDIAVQLKDYNQNEFIGAGRGLTIEDVGLSRYTGSYNLAAFKNDVQVVLENAFGANRVERGDKALRISSAAFGIPADVVPCETTYTWFSQTHREEGIRLLSDRRPARSIENFPQQHLERGVAKNNACSRRYKRVVRILKRLENEMKDKGIIDPIPSFLIESAVFNVPTASFGSTTWTGRVRASLAHIFNGTLDANCMNSGDWMEANNIKFLFNAGQRWTPTTAHTFAGKAWDYIGFD